MTDSSKLDVVHISLAINKFIYHFLSFTSITAMKYFVLGVR